LDHRKIGKRSLHGPQKKNCWDMPTKFVKRNFDERGPGLFVGNPQNLEPKDLHPKPIRAFNETGKKSQVRYGIISMRLL